MNIIGIILAILLLIGFVFGIGYGAVSGYEFLSVQWGSINDDWKAILIIIATLLIFCTLLISLSFRSSIKNYGFKGTGKVMAYNDFMQWYSALISDNVEAMQADTLKAITNQTILWGSNQVAKQVSLLYDLLQKDDTEKEQVLEKAGDVYIEIRRELGLRGTSGDNAIV